MFAAWQVGQMFWSFLWFTLFFMWIWLMISIFADIFRSPDLGGWSKALWTLFVIVAPFLGALVYLIARGHKMSEHAMQQAQAQEAAMRSILWYETAETRQTLSPLEFAYSFMMRTGKVNHERLRRIDPDFLAAYEAEAAGKELAGGV